MGVVSLSPKGDPIVATMSEGADELLGKQQSLVAAVGKLSASLKKMVEDGRENFRRHGDINDFVRSHGKGDLYGLLTLYPVQLYASCFKSLGIQSRKELESLWSSFFVKKEVQDSVEELLSAEESYEDLIEELDRVLAEYEEKTALPVIRRGEVFNTDATLVEATTGDEISLNEFLKESPYTLFVLRKHYV